jgi:hypothetical protein
MSENKYEQYRQYHIMIRTGCTDEFIQEQLGLSKKQFIKFARDAEETYARVLDEIGIIMTRHMRAATNEIASLKSLIKIFGGDKKSVLKLDFINDAGLRADTNGVAFSIKAKGQLVDGPEEIETKGFPFD